MQRFRLENRERSEASRRLWALYEIAYAAADFTAAISFLVGSVLFFRAATDTAAIWLFVIGSFCFMLKPTIRLVRELHLYRRGRLEPLAERAEE